MTEKQNHFQIYGRTSYEQPLSFVAELVVAGTTERLVAEALAEAGDDGWVELVAIPTDAMLHVTGKKDDD